MRGTARRCSKRGKRDAEDSSGVTGWAGLTVAVWGCCVQGEAGQGKAEEFQAVAVAEAGCHKGRRRAALADIRSLVAGEFGKKGGGRLVSCSRKP